MYILEMQPRFKSFNLFPAMINTILLENISLNSGAI